MANEVGLKSPLSSPLFSERVRTTLSERLKLHQHSSSRRRRRQPDCQVEEDDESKNRWKKRRSSIARVITFPERTRQEDEQFSRQEQLQQQATSSSNQVKKAGDSLEFVNQMMAQISQENMIKWSFDFCQRRLEDEEAEKQTTSQEEEVLEGQRKSESCREISSETSSQETSSSGMISPSFGTLSRDDHLSMTAFLVVEHHQRNEDPKSKC